MTTRVSFYLDDEVHAALLDRGSRRGMSRLANTILRKGLDLDSPDPQQLIAEAVRSLRGDPDVVLSKVAEANRLHGPEAGMQILLAAAGAQLRTMETS